MSKHIAWGRVAAVIVTAVVFVVLLDLAGRH